MRTAAVAISVAVACTLSACASPPPSEGPPPAKPEASEAPLAAKRTALEADRHQGRKVKVTGVYRQSYSKGGRPEDPWVLVIGDDPSSLPTLGCVVPAKVDIPGRYPKIVAEGTLVGTGEDVLLQGCTYQVE